MARTILEIAREAAERDATAPAPSKLFDTNNRVARILRTALKDTMRDYLAKVGGWQGASEFHSTWAFSLVKGRFAYQLPPDFLRVIPNTQQRDGWTLGLLGPATPQTWARWLSGSAGATAPMGWRIKNNLLFIEPVPASTELVTIEYISRYPVISEIREGDYDLSVTPIKINAPLVPRDGHMSDGLRDVVSPPTPEDASYDGAPGYDVGKWGKDTHEELRRINPLSDIEPLPQVRRPEFTSDDDMPAFEDDHILSLGLTYRLRRGLGLPYIEQAADYEQELDTKANSDAGNNTGFTVGGDEDVADVLPLGNGVWALS